MSTMWAKIDNDTKAYQQKESAIMQAKRIQVSEATVAAGNDVAVIITTPEDVRQETNFHNIWGGAAVVPVDAASNCAGTWLLMIRPVNVTITGNTDAVINAEDKNRQIIACGVWSASNETPFNLQVNPKTSRNLNPGDQLTLTLHITSVTAGLVQIRAILCAHVIRK